jgi:hypothetical protein
VKDAVMTTAANRLVLAGLVAAALLPRASSAQDLDQLNEDLRVETARLEYALEKVQRVQYPVTGDDRRIRKALLKDGRFLMKQAATVPRDAVPQMEELLRLMAEKRAEADRFVDDVRPLWQEQQRRRAEEGAPRPSSVSRARTSSPGSRGSASPTTGSGAGSSASSSASVRSSRPSSRPACPIGVAATPSSRSP